MTATSSSVRVCECSGAQRFTRRSGWSGPSPRSESSQPEFHQERNCYVCKQSFAKMHRYYDSMCEACGEFNYAKREQTAESRGPLRTHHRRARQDRVSGILKVAARRRACDCHHALSSGCRRSLLEGARLWRISRAPADSRTRFAAYAERRVVHAVLVGTAAAAGLPSEQRLPDRAAAGRIFRASARARECAARRAA